MNGYTRFLIRRAGWIAALGAIITVFATQYTIKLFQNLRTDMEELLPTTSRSVIDLASVSGRLQTTQNLAILIFSDHPSESERYVTDLAAQLEQIPRNIVAGVEYRIDRELEFFRKRRALYIELADLIRIRDFIRERIEYEKELFNPLNIFRSSELREPNLDFQAIEGKYSQKVSMYAAFPGGFYSNPEQTIRVILVHQPAHSSGISGALQMKSEVEKAVASLSLDKYAPDIRVAYTNSVQDFIEEHHSLIKDLGLSLVLTIVLVCTALLLYYRTFWGTAALMASLIMGTLWTFGASYFAVGYLNANSAFLGAIVIGNGINFGIILLARYIEERKKGFGHVRACHSATTKTAPATWTASLAAGLAYGSLMLTGFRGFNQYGVIGLIGMILCWVSAFTLLPAFLTLLDKWRPLNLTAAATKEKPFFTGALVTLVGRYPKPIWALSFLLSIASIGVALNYDGQIIQTDITKLRDKRSMLSGSGYLSKYLDQVFQRYMSPVVVLPKTREDAEKITAKLKEIQAREGAKSHIAGIRSIDDFLPKHQERKIEILQEIKMILPERIMKRLTGEERSRISEFLNPNAFKPITIEQLPALVLDKFTEKDGTIGKLVLVEPPLTNELQDGDNLVSFIARVRGAADSVAPGTPVAGSLTVFADMFQAIRSDGPKATIFAFLAVVLLIIFLFRNLTTIALCLFALILGVLWMTGVIFVNDWKINFLNFIALPITFGIGVDYGVNIFQRYKQEGHGNILSVLRHTGGAVGLASLTTIIGYGSLLLAGNQAFVSFGRLAVLGEITCLVAATLSLPAYLCYKDRLKMLQIMPISPRLFWHRVHHSVAHWPQWFRALPVREKLMPLPFVAIYWGLFIGFDSFRPLDHLSIGLAFAILWYAGPVGRSAFKFFLPLGATAFLYDSQRFYSDSIRGPIRVEEPYWFDKTFFGINVGGEVLTPNEFFQIHNHPILDLVTGAAYLLFVLIFFTTIAYFYYWLSKTGTRKLPGSLIERMRGRMGWAFFWINALGYSTYYWYAAAPPWYVTLYGLGPAKLDTPANPAGCLRFDALLGVSWFHEMYSRSADVFGAIPSLHVAYPLLAVYYAFKFGSLRFFSVFFFLLMCFAAVYLNHHYVLDIIWGCAYTILVAVTMDFIANWRDTRKANHAS